MDEKLKIWQEGAYLASSEWPSIVHIKYTTRLNCVLRYAKILYLYGLVRDDEPKGKLKVLEPGCGIGVFSSILTIFGKVYSFDYASNAIKIAEGLFGNNKDVLFFVGDGVSPGSIPELSEEKFDFIFMKEFYPLSLNIADIAKPLEVVSRYYNMLNKGGVMIIEQAFHIKTLKKDYNILQVPEIINKFSAVVLDTFSLDLMLNFPLILKQKSLRLLCSKLLRPAVLVLCLMKKIKLPRTIIIRKCALYA